MTRSILFVVAAGMLLLTAPLMAEQIVVLKSGATLLGDIAFDNDSVVIQIADGKLRVEMSEVVAIATLSGAGGVSTGAAGQAEQLSMKALEARLMNGAGEEVLRILAEVARLAPDDPRVAY